MVCVPPDLTWPWTVIAAGSIAPAFTLPDTAGRMTSLEQFRGQPVLLVFLPAAFTPVCAAELEQLGQIHTREQADPATVLGVACDSVFTLRTWGEQAMVPTPLLSDFWPHGDICRAYEAFDADRGLATRTSYLIDGDGLVRWSTQNPAGIARDMNEHLTQVQMLTGRHGR
ncbi:MAG: redoxin domain-containing protein [Beutenbergiaceae bacterium]